MLLGMAGDMIEESSRLTHYVTKVGGHPWYPKVASEGLPPTPTCDSCSQSMVLVLQVHGSHHIYTMDCMRIVLGFIGEIQPVALTLSRLEAILSDIDSWKLAALDVEAWRKFGLSFARWLCQFAT